MAADSVKITNMPDGGSPQRVAYDLMSRIIHLEAGQTNTRKAVLDLYAECLDAAHGYRKYSPTT